MKFNLFIKLQNNINIYVDKHNWILDCGDKNNRSYYGSLDALLDDLLERNITAGALSLECVKDISSVINLIEETRVLVRKDIEAIEKQVIKTDRTLKEGGLA